MPEMFQERVSRCVGVENDISSVCINMRAWEHVELK